MKQWIDESKDRWYMEIELELEVEIAIEKEIDREREWGHRTFMIQQAQPVVHKIPVVFADVPWPMRSLCQWPSLLEKHPCLGKRTYTPRPLDAISSRVQLSGHLNQDFWYSICGFVGKWGTSKCAAWSSWSKLIQVDHDLSQTIAINCDICDISIMIWGWINTY